MKRQRNIGHVRIARVGVPLLFLAGLTGLLLPPFVRQVAAGCNAPGGNKCSLQAVTVAVSLSSVCINGQVVFTATPVTDCPPEMFSKTWGGDTGTNTSPGNVWTFTTAYTTPGIKTVTLTVTGAEWPGEPPCIAIVSTNVPVVKVEIVLTNQYPDIPISPIYSATPGKKWVIATFPEPDQINVNWDVQLLGMANADAAIKYQRGTSAEADVGWAGTPGDVFFTNGWLNASVRLNDGSNSIPQMSLASNVLTISSVQQGDRIIVEEPSTGCRDQIAVVKNFSWNDLQRLGIGDLEMDADFSSLNGALKDAIVDTVVFCLDPRTTRDQKPQLTNDCFPDSGASTINYTNFHAAHTNLLQLDIPSSRSVGMYPWDYDHWHMGLEVEPLPSTITNKQAILEDVADDPWVSFPVFQSNTVAKLVDLLNTTYADANTSFLLSHTYEGGEGSAAKYVDPAGVKTLKPGDPIRNIRWEFTSNNYPRLSYPGQEDDAEWGHGNEPPAKVWQVDMFVNRNGKVVISAGASAASGQISDALRE